MAKNYPFIHKLYTLCVLCVLRGEFLQWTHLYFPQWGEEAGVGPRMEACPKRGEPISSPLVPLSLRQR